MGGVTKSISKLLGTEPAKVSVPEVPNYEDERKKAEDEALRTRSRLKGLGMQGTILGGSVGDDNSVKKKKLLGE